MQLLESYKAVNPAMIQLVSLDPYSDLTRGDELVKRVPELEFLHGGGASSSNTARARDAQHVVVRNQDLFQPIPLDPAHGGLEPVCVGLHGRRRDHIGIDSLARGQEVEGRVHDRARRAVHERLESAGRGIGNWKARLAKVGCEVIDLNLIQDEIPADLSLLIVVGPKGPFKPDELAKLKAFTDQRAGRSCSSGQYRARRARRVLQVVQPGDRQRARDRSPVQLQPATPDLVFAPTSAGNEAPDRRSAGDEPGRAPARAAPIHMFGQSTRGQPPTEPVDPNLVPAPILRTSQILVGREPTPENPPHASRSRTATSPARCMVGVAVSERAGKDPPAGEPPRASRGSSCSRARPWPKTSFRRSSRPTSTC